MKENVDPVLETVFSAVAKDVEGARLVLESIWEDIQAGDYTRARANLAMGLVKRLHDAEEEARALDGKLAERGGVYPPPGKA